MQRAVIIVFIGTADVQALLVQTNPQIRAGLRAVGAQFSLRNKRQVERSLFELLRNSLRSMLQRATVMMHTKFFFLCP